MEVIPDRTTFKHGIFSYFFSPNGFWPGGTWTYQWREKKGGVPSTRFWKKYMNWELGRKSTVQPEAHRKLWSAEHEVSVVYVWGQFLQCVLGIGNHFSALLFLHLWNKINNPVHSLVFCKEMIWSEFFLMRAMEDQFKLAQIKDKLLALGTSAHPRPSC